MQSEQERQQACAGGRGAGLHASTRQGGLSCLFLPVELHGRISPRQALHAPHVVCSNVQQTGGESSCLWRVAICQCWATLMNVSFPDIKCTPLVALLWSTGRRSAVLGLIGRQRV